jgi:hypothetical protein
MFDTFKKILDIVRYVLVALLFVAMAFALHTENYAMAIVDLLLIIIFELQELNSKFK